MKEIKKIKNLSLANITAAIYGLVGFFIALAAAVFTMANIIRQSGFNGSVFLVALFNLGAGILVGLAVAAIMAVLGWILGFITSAFYNMFAARLGGVEIELAESETEAGKESEKDGSAKEENKINI